MEPMNPPVILPEEFEVIDPVLAMADAEIDYEQPVKKLYIGKQQELYLYATLAWENYKKHQAVFGNFSPAYTMGLATEQLAFIALTKAMADQDARVVIPLSAKSDLSNLNTNVLDLFTDGTIYIERTYTDPDQRKLMLKAAGLQYLKDATDQNWSSTSSLISAFKLFLTTHGPALEASNQMPKAFPDLFTAAAEPFENLWSLYKDAWKAALKERWIKATNNNLIYKVAADMCEVGKKKFAKNKTVKKEFTLTSLHGEVSGNSPAGVGGVFSIEGKKKSRIAMVKVSVKNDPERVAFSDKNGSYELRLLSEQTYEIMVEAEGYVPQTFTKYIKKGIVSRLSAALVPIPPPAPEVEPEG